MKSKQILPQLFSKAFLKCLQLLVILTTFFMGLHAQRKIDLTDLSEFQTPAANWQLVGDARTDLEKDNAFFLTPGKSILVSQAKENTHGQDLLFNSMHGDADVELDYIMAKNSNSGIYLQGRYEIQVLDSYGLDSKDNDCGGIYKIAAPLKNACRKPEEWQSYDVAFRTARVENDALKEKPRVTVFHNDVMIHNNLEIPTPTGGAMVMDMRKPGSLLLQDHGDLVRYRNVWVLPINNG